jgi:hypothetical protein
MYQALIWRCAGARRAGNHARRLSAPLDAEDLERLADALVDGVGRNSQPDRDFLRRHVLVYEHQAVALAVAQARDALLERFRNRGILVPRHIHRNRPLARHEQNSIPDDIPSLKLNKVGNPTGSSLILPWSNKAFWSADYPRTVSGRPVGANRGVITAHVPV